MNWRQEPLWRLTWMTSNSFKVRRQPFRNLTSYASLGSLYF